MRVPPAFLIALLALGAVITTDVVPGVFSVDDNNYLINVLALREGRLTVPQTDGLPPSPELLFFDPGPWARTVATTPVASTAPPLYAPMALPFSVFGWRGLVALNTLAYLATALMIFVFAQRRSASALTPWIAAGAFALGGFSIEYAEGPWPHSLSVALCTAGVLAAVRASERGEIRSAMIAGGLIALATGMRYQNAVILGAVGLGLVIWSARRWRVVAAFALAASVPLAVSATMNHARHGSWNPISKGPGYLNVPVPGSAGRAWNEPAVMLWARVVDYSARPPLTSRAFNGWLRYDQATGSHIMPGGIVKKALLQSAPWAVLGFVMLAFAWGRAAWTPVDGRRALLIFSLVVGAVLAAFSFSGAGRDDGFSFNQRYLLELVPILAIASAWALDRAGAGYRSLAAGALIGAGVLVLMMAMARDAVVWRVIVMKAPLVLAGLVLLAWVLSKRSTHGGRALTAAAGVCLGWALAMHVTQDLQGSHQMRRYNQARTVALGEVLRDGSVLVAYWGHKDAAVPLLFDRDLLILDTSADEGADAPRLIRHLLQQGRDVVLLDEGFPGEVREKVIGGLQLETIRHPAPRLLAVRLGGL